MTREEILAMDYDDEVLDKACKDRIVVSHYKYGPVSVNYGQGHVDINESIEKRWKAWQDTHNTEFLVDMINLCRIAFRYPQYKDAYFKGTDSSESPGLVGMSINEIKRFDEDKGDY